PAYLASLTRYNKALTQRNALLKSWRGLDAASRQSLQSYTPVMAKEAAYITDRRENYVRRLSEEAARIYSDMTDNAELMKAFYRGRRTEDEFAMLFRDYENRDVDAAMTLIGPQRDDITVLLDGIPARQMASQGQQRAIVLSLKLAEGEISRESTGEYPVFLLDDVLSEIDAPRREYLMGELAAGGRQVIITTCESEIKGDKIYEMEKGELTVRE
nr:DNA replication and repair protein RecF [Clostridiales bacterium]